MEFRQPIGWADETERLSSVAITFNDILLDRELPGYRTLKVSGRETISNELVTESTNEGSITLDSYLPPRTIQVTYEMKADSGTLFQSRYKELRKLLDTNYDVEVKFEDEPGTTYFGRLSTFGDVPDDKNHIVSTFTIHCDSPYKYGDLMTTTGQVPIDTFYQAPPELITLKVSSTTNRIEITSGFYSIKATGTFNAGSTVLIRFLKEEVMMLVNGVESTYMIDLQSDLENFVLYRGQTVTSPQGTLTIGMRERWL